MTIEGPRRTTYCSFPSRSEVNNGRPYNTNLQIKYLAFFSNITCIKTESEEAKIVEGLRIQAN